MRSVLPERTSRRLVSLGRPQKQALMLLCDVALLMLAAWLAYCFRLGQWFVPSASQWALMSAAPLLALPVFIRLGLYRSVIRYVGEQVLWTVFQGMSIAALLWATLAFMTQMTGVQGAPRMVPVLYWLVGLVLVAGARFLARWLLWQPLRRRFLGRQVLIYGAGGAGRQLAVSLRAGRELFPAGFIDDDEALQGKDMDGLRVYAPEDIPALIKRFGIHDMIVTLPSESHRRRREVVSLLEKHPLRVRILPAMTDIANGKHLVNMVREVDVGDLLGRDPVAADPALMGRCIDGKVVLVTGAGGSIGRELCRQIAGRKPAKLVLLDASEHALYQVDRMLRNSVGFQVVPCLGSVAHAELVERMLREHQVQTIYHAAAYKHVPLVQANVLEGTINNVLGTAVLARAAYRAGVGTFVLISTDKAVRPTNVMGATKRWAELIVQDYAVRARQLGLGSRFCAVRFGNVLGSSGSVIPLFREQIGQGGPVTVTHAEVTRYFMSIHEAVELVIQAGSLAQGQEIFLLDMGEPVRIMDLARNMISLAGYTVRDGERPDGDIEVAITGLRPGEKLHEELLIATGHVEGTPHPKIMRAQDPTLTLQELDEQLKLLRSAVDAGDVARVQQQLMTLACKSPPAAIAREAVAVNPPPQTPVSPTGG